jgi:hypothetical protein
MSNFDLWQDFLSNKKSMLRDFSYAGNGAIYPDMPCFEAKDYGIFPDTGEDVTEKLQNALDIIGKKGGGRLLLSKGCYNINGEKSSHKGLLMNYSHVALEGVGNGCDGTVLVSHSNTLQQKLPYLCRGLIHTADCLFGTERFLSPKLLKSVGKIVKDAEQGSDILKLDSSENVNAGDCVILCMYDNAEHSLAKELMYPLKLDEEWTDIMTAYERKSAPYQWLARIRQVRDDSTIVLDRPLLRDIKTKYTPEIFYLDMLENISIENIRFESVWDGGGYYHHKNAEVDYGWNGIVMHRVINGTVKNVHFHNFTQAVQLRDCKNVSVNGVEISGYDGHYGVKCYAHTSDCLMENIHVYSTFTHGLGLEGSNQGNVFKDVWFHSSNTEIDLHGGGMPSFNLFENVRNIAKVSGGGAIFNMPYCGQGNVYWNCTYAPCPPKGRLSTYLEHDNVSGDLKQARLKEFFHAWFWSYYKQYKELRDHEMYPASIVRGLGGGFINKSLDPRKEKSICVCSSQSNDILPSLYQAQKENR